MEVSSAFAPNERISFKAENPKKNGSAAAARYDLYKGAKTVEEAYELGAWKGDIINDEKRGYLTRLDKHDGDTGADAVHDASGANGSSGEGGQTPASSGGGAKKQQSKKRPRPSCAAASKGADADEEPGRGENPEGQAEGAEGGSSSSAGAPTAAESASASATSKCRRLRKKQKPTPAWQAELDKEEEKKKTWSKQKRTKAGKSTGTEKDEDGEATSGKQGKTKDATKGKGKKPQRQISDDELGYRLFDKRCGRDKDAKISTWEQRMTERLHIQQWKTKEEADKRKAWQEFSKRKRKELINQAIKKWEEEREKQRQYAERGPAFTFFSRQLLANRKKLRQKRKAAGEEGCMPTFRQLLIGSPTGTADDGKSKGRGAHKKGRGHVKPPVLVAPPPPVGGGSPEHLEISGAGVQAVNGIYTKDGMTAGQEVRAYTKRGVSLYDTYAICFFPNDHPLGPAWCIKQVEDEGAVSTNNLSWLYKASLRGKAAADLTETPFVPFSGWETKHPLGRDPVPMIQAAMTEEEGRSTRILLAEANVAPAETKEVLAATLQVLRETSEALSGHRSRLRHSLSDLARNVTNFLGNIDANRRHRPHHHDLVHDFVRGEAPHNPHGFCKHVLDHPEQYPGPIQRLVESIPYQVPTGFHRMKKLVEKANEYERKLHNQLSQNVNVEPKKMLDGLDITVGRILPGRDQKMKKFMERAQEVKQIAEDSQKLYEHQCELWLRAQRLHAKEDPSAASSSSLPEMLTEPRAGVKVIRGRDWNSGNQDANGDGMTMGQPAYAPYSGDGMVRVFWLNTSEYGSHRCGKDGCFDLYVSPNHKERHDAFDMGFGAHQHMYPGYPYGMGSRPLKEEPVKRQLQALKPTPTPSQELTGKLDAKDRGDVLVKETLGEKCRIGCGNLTPTNAAALRALAGLEPVGMFAGFAAAQPPGLQERTYLVDNGKLQATTPGLSYRTSMDMESKATELARWGSTIEGTAVSDDWVRVGDARYLPVALEGVPVLTMRNGSDEVDATEWRLLPEETVTAAAAVGGPKSMQECTEVWRNVQCAKTGEKVTKEYMEWVKAGKKTDAAKAPLPFGASGDAGTWWFCEECEQWLQTYSRSHHNCPNGENGKARLFGPQFMGESFSITIDYARTGPAGEGAPVNVSINAALGQVLARLNWASFWPSDQMKAFFRLVKAQSQADGSPEAASFGAAAYVAKRDEDEPGVSGAPAAAVFSLASCSDMSCAPPPAGFRLPLFTAQCRTLAWMRSREEQPLEYLSREVLKRPCLDTDLEVELRVDRHWQRVRGGILADSVGYGKTACLIGLVQEGQKRPIQEVLSLAEREELSKKFILSNATLVVTPPNLFEQWLGEFQKFLDPKVFETLRIVEIPHIQRLNALSVEDFANADVVIVPYRFFFSPSYERHLDEAIDRELHLGEASKGSTTQNSRFEAQRYALLRDSVAKLLRPKDDGQARESESKADDKAGEGGTGEEESPLAQRLKKKLKLDDIVADGGKSSSSADGGKPSSSTDAGKSSSSADAGKAEDGCRTTLCGQTLDLSTLECMAPTLEAFYWRRVVFDEFHEVLGIRQGRPYHALRQLFAKFHWGLTATPCLSDAQAVSDMASLLHISIPTWSPPEAQHFLDEWVRSSTWDTRSVPMKNHVIPVHHTKQERLLYLHERSQLLNREGRTSFHAEERLLQLCSHYSPGSGVIEGDGSAGSAVVQRRNELHEELSKLRVTTEEAKSELPSATRRRDATARLRAAFRALGLPSGAAGRNAALAVGDANRLAGEHGPEELEDFAQRLEAYVASTGGEQAKGAANGASAAAPGVIDDDDDDGRDEAPSSRPAAVAVPMALPGDLRNFLTTLANTVRRTRLASYKRKYELVGRELESHVHQLQNLIEKQQEQIKRLESSTRFFDNCLGCLEADSGEALECPICMDETDPSPRAITRCGHVFHDKCIRMVINEKQGCPTCRVPLAHKDVSFVRQALDDRAMTEEKKKASKKEEDEAPKYGSKLAKIVERLRKVREEEPGAKIIMFCQWERILRFLADALSASGEPPPLVLRGHMLSRQRTLRDFTSSSDPRHSVLLLSLEQSPTGMNLVCCRHLFLVHPFFAQTRERAVAFELQAIGRLRRQGQQRLVEVHRFVTVGTVEEDISQRHQTHLDEVMEERQGKAKEAPAAAKKAKKGGGGRAAASSSAGGACGDQEGRGASSSAAAVPASSSSGGSAPHGVSEEAEAEGEGEISEVRQALQRET